MRGFRYKHGDRPLEGYTIQRAAGRGGFGEVYYAVSDSGREVALKVVQGYEQIELRGVSQCMNLKSPHLVTIFDVKHNGEGVPFVIMEFVAGPSLRQLLDECPQGLGTQKAAFFLREIGKGLQYLHDCGIVHRDLKPGNIFYENGYVKIGDYGLSKAIATTQHSGQTITVGTVHYMAPEISMGKYDQAIDIYAMGAMLYEMLTGQVPYLGGSPGEILMKHMTAEPNVAGIEEPFATVIRKAMHRDPAARYQSVQEMVEAVFGSEHVQQSVSCFSPDSLTMVAQRVANRVAVGGGSATPPPLPRNRGGVAVAEDGLGDWADRFGKRMEQIGDRVGTLGERLGRRMADFGARMGGAVPAAGVAAEATTGADWRRDPLSKKQRNLLTLSVMVILAAAMGMFRPDFVRGDDIVPIIFLSFAAIGGAAAGILIAVHRVVPQLAQESHGMRRFAIGGLGGAGLLLFSMLMIAAAPSHARDNLSRMIIPILAALFLTDWTRCTDPGRPERISFKRALIAAAIGFGIGILFGASPQLVIGILAGIALVVQIKSPWDPVAGRQALAAMEMPRMDDSGMPAGAAGMIRQGVDGLAAAPVMTAPPPLPMSRAMAETLPQVPTWVRVLWMLHVPATLSVGLVLLIIAGMENHGNTDFAIMVACGIGLLVLAGFCIRKAVQRTFRGWWSYLIKPLLVFFCIQTILVSALVLGNGNLNSEDTAIGIFFIVFPAAMLVTLSLIRTGGPKLQTGGMPVMGSVNAVTANAVTMINPQAGPAPVNPAVVPPVASKAAAPAAASTITVVEVLAHSRNFLLGVIGWVLLLASIVVGLAVAVDIPGLLAVGLPDPQLAENLNREAAKMQVESWPNLFRTLLVIFAGLGMFLSVAFLMMARRSSGMGHMLRSVLGALAVVVALFQLHAALAGHWVRVVDAMGRPSMPASIDAFFQQAQGVMVVFAAVFMLVALALLFWPASRRQAIARA